MRWTIRTAGLILALPVAVPPLRAAEKPGGDFDPTVTPPAAERVVVTASNENRLQEIDPAIGNRIYRLEPAVIDGQGRGQDAGFDEVLLHAPGVSRESGGQHHLRGEDYGLQYRLNGIQLPEGTAHALGQPFDTRLIRSVSVLAGALPAQYGLHRSTCPTKAICSTTPGSAQPRTSTVSAGASSAVCSALSDAPVLQSIVGPGRSPRTI